jgi:replication factor A1
MTKIAELEDGSRNVNVRAVVVSKEEPREVNTKFGPTLVCNATIEDESGSITLVLWGKDSGKIKEGDNIKIENGFVSTWNTGLQLSVGKFGKLITENDAEEGQR